MRRLPLLPTLVVAAAVAVMIGARHLAAPARALEGSAARRICRRRGNLPRARSRSAAGRRRARCRRSLSAACSSPAAPRRRARSARRAQPRGQGGYVYLIPAARARTAWRAASGSMSAGRAADARPPRSRSAASSPGRLGRGSSDGQPIILTSATRRAAARAERAARASTTSRTTISSTRSNGSSSPPSRLLIYLLALRRRGRRSCRPSPERLNPAPLMMRLTTLDNGLKVASRAMPGFETVAVGLYADVGSRHEPAQLNGIAHLYEHMVFKGAGGRDGARNQRGDRGCRRRSQRRDRPRGHQFHRHPARRASAARAGVDLRHDPAARISGPRIWRARRRSCCRSWARRATRRPTSSSTICGRPPGRTSRSAARCSATRPASRRSRSTICTAGGPSAIAAAA